MITWHFSSTHWNRTTINRSGLEALKVKYSLSIRKIVTEIAIMNKMVIVTIRIVIWRLLRHNEVSLNRLGVPNPLTIVKCVELATDSWSTSLVFVNEKILSLAFIVDKLEGLSVSAAISIVLSAAHLISFGCSMSVAIGRLLS